MTVLYVKEEMSSGKLIKDAESKKQKMVVGAADYKNVGEILERNRRK